jgi:hypothetical protein
MGELFVQPFEQIAEFRPIMQGRKGRHVFNQAVVRVLRGWGRRCCLAGAVSHRYSLNTKMQAQALQLENGRIPTASEIFSTHFKTF